MGELPGYGEADGKGVVKSKVGVDKGVGYWWQGWQRVCWRFVMDV